MSKYTQFFAAIFRQAGLRQWGTCLEELNKDYLTYFLLERERHLFKKAEEIFEGEITGIDSLGKLKINVDGTTEYFEVKEIQFLR